MLFRREFIKSCSLSSAGLMANRSIVVRSTEETDELAAKAIDAAVQGGASYADVRLTLTRSRNTYQSSPPSEAEAIAVGVRVLVNGGWGFASSAYWTTDEMSRLARSACDQALYNRWGDLPGQTMDLSSLSGASVTSSDIKNGNKSPEWSAPIVCDPFEVSLEEHMDYVGSIASYIREYRGASLGYSPLKYRKQHKTFASTKGFKYSQTTYESLCDDSFMVIGVTDRSAAIPSSIRWVPDISPSGEGYEALASSSLLKNLDEYINDARSGLYAQQVSSSRYDVVFDAYAMAPILGLTIGMAMDLDRALGIEANAGGTSYLSLESAGIGTRVGSDLLTVTADRTSSGGVSSVGWDDDGISARSFRLVDTGLVTGYSANIEYAGASGFTSSASAISQDINNMIGCCGASDASFIPMVYTPNLTLHPSSQNTSMDDLIASVDDGIFIKGGMCFPDHQLLGVHGLGELVFRIRKGKVAERFDMGTGYIFKSTEFWKKLSVLGGQSTVQRKGVRSSKGQPVQNISFSVTTPAAIVRDIGIINMFPVMQAKTQL